MTFGDGTEFNTSLSSARTINIEGPFELEGTVELGYVTMNIAYGVTVDIEDGDVLILTGASMKPTAVNVYGVLYGYSGGEVRCSGSNAKIFSKINEAEIGDVDFDQAGFMNNMATCPDSCIAPVGGLIHITTTTVNNGGFLGRMAGANSMFVVPDGTTITYEAGAGTYSIQNGSTVLLGDNAKLIYEKPGDIGSNGAAQTIFKWATTNTKWGWIELRANGNEF